MRGRVVYLVVLQGHPTSNENIERKIYAYTRVNKINHDATRRKKR